ncbi:Hypothetical predicted protein [Paramuricea clavata]|uniref:Uncharacterized protein n=1 Tax=Paramuricea clavata TaxID=317549 RepID=A0A6S7GG45_PARCT|nr:Hypothetical predicted protein [Paramuricea clavata]
MASAQQQQDLKLFFEYQGVRENDVNRLHYVQKFTDFQFFRLANPVYSSFDRAYIKWLQQPTYQAMENNMIIQPMQFEKPSLTFMDVQQPPPYTSPPVLNNVNNYNTDLLSIMNPINPNTLYPNNDEAEYLLNETTTEILESSSDDQATSPATAPPPPSTPVKKTLTPMGKNINNLKRSLKRKASSTTSKSGRPNKHVHLTRIANNQADQEKFSSQDVILYALDGTEKKRKTILTTSNETLETYNIKHYQCYVYLGDKRVQALEKIKIQKEKLEKLCYLEKFTIESLKNRQNRKLEKNVL